MMRRVKRWGYGIAAVVSAGATVWMALGTQTETSPILDGSVSSLLRRAIGSAPTPNPKASLEAEPELSSMSPEPPPSPCPRIDTAGFELGMTVAQTLAALDGRRLTGRAILEYGVVSASGEISRRTTGRRADVLPPRPGRFV